MVYWYLWALCLRLQELFLIITLLIIAGISEALAGAFSMGTDAFFAFQAERQVYRSEINKELKEVDSTWKCITW